MEQRPTPSPSEGDSKRALLEAKEIFVRDDDERRANSKDDDSEPRKSRLLPILFMATVVLGAYALVTRPPWLITPPPTPESPVVVEASLRVAMWQQALYVERYRREEGRLPVDLVEAGAPTLHGVFYHQVGDDSYLITGSNGQVDLVLRAEESFDEFLGESLHTISNRGES